MWLPIADLPERRGVLYVYFHISAGLGIPLSSPGRLSCRPIIYAPDRQLGAR